MYPGRDSTYLVFRISAWINGIVFDFGFTGATEGLSEDSESESDEEGSLFESESLEESESELELELGEDPDEDED